MKTKLVVIIQCDIAQNRCSGAACMNCFYEREGTFKDYGEDEVRYISFTCGGCCGKSVAAKLEHLSKKYVLRNGLSKDEVVIHLSSCMVTDNYHYDRCPHVDYIKGIVAKKGFQNVIDGTFISKGASKKREEGIYKCYED
jgi:predicted metal-binding protein